MFYVAYGQSGVESHPLTLLALVQCFIMMGPSTQ